MAARARAAAIASSFGRVVGIRADQVQPPRLPTDPPALHPPQNPRVRAQPAHLGAEQAHQREAPARGQRFGIRPRALFRRLVQPLQQRFALRVLRGKISAGRMGAREAFGVPRNGSASRRACRDRDIAAARAEPRRGDSDRRRSSAVPRPAHAGTGATLGLDCERGKPVPPESTRGCVSRAKAVPFVQFARENRVTDLVCQ